MEGVAASMHAASQGNQQNLIPENENDVDERMSAVEEALPDPLTIAQAPSVRKEANFYNQASRRGVEPTPPSSVQTEFTDSIFPKVTITHKQAMIGHHKMTVNAVEEHPENYVQIIPHNSGYEFFMIRTGGSVASAIYKWLSTCSFEGETEEEQEWELFSPSPPSNPPSTFPHSAPPYTVLAKGLSAQRRTWMLYQQTFAVSKTLAFHVTPVDPTIVGTWHLGNWEIPSMLVISERKRVQILAAMINGAWRHSRFRALTIKATKSHPDYADLSAPERVIEATKTWDLRILTPGTEDEDEETRRKHNTRPVLQLIGQPLENTPVAHNTWLNTLHQIKFVVNNDTLITYTKRVVTCTGSRTSVGCTCGGTNRRASNLGRHASEKRKSQERAGNWERKMENPPEGRRRKLPKTWTRWWQKKAQRPGNGATS
ncbi:hypothetical protein K435DRAFT_793548 [Dendrothele bispora CBS 962.96]|uniref:Uncharacterized protein n=1 Tax=Dendrothele bispora (strain CBS 962.96) TaxID=1314807 RepID=A0A4S8MF01_DENBC|nr:hypothetical protein K435DRAFT_793548 [Dendrothele bispora CBS 962.96]